MQPYAYLRSRPALAVAVAALLPLVAALSLTPLRDRVSTTTAALVLVCVVVLACTVGLRLAGLTAVVSAVVWFDFLLVPPYQSFSIANAEDVEAAVLLLVIGGLVTELALWGQRQQAGLSRSQGYLDGILGAAASAADPEADSSSVTASVAERMRTVLGADSCTFVPGGPPGPATALLRRDGSLSRDGRPLDVDHDGLPTDVPIAVPVETAGGPGGYFRLVAASRLSRPSPRARRVAMLLADQTGRLLH
jgi:K+-sensing histidine kinase KdpD